MRKGPIFANIVLADEINRTPPKTQAALLEAMQEHHVTAGSQTYRLPEPFFVLATQNPIEQEGTYPLPEAQLDRFMFQVMVDYPGEDEELEIVRRTTTERSIEVLPPPFGNGRPPVQGNTLLLWGGPLALLILGIVALIRYQRRRAEAPAASRP